MTNKKKSPNKNVSPSKLGFYWLLVIFIIFCELLAYTFVRTESTHTILRVSKAQQMNTGKASYHKALSVERDRLKSDERITSIAKTRLNLSTDVLNQTIYLSTHLPGEEG